MSARRSTPTNTTPRPQDARTDAAPGRSEPTHPYPDAPAGSAGRTAPPAPSSSAASTRRHALTGSRTRRSLQLMGRGMRSEWRVYVLAIGASAMFGATTVGISLAVGRVTDEVVVPALAGDAGAREDLWVAGLVLVGIAVTLALTVAARRIFAGYGYANIQARHRTAVTHQYLRLPMSWHRSHPAGQLLSNANSDVEAATGVFNPLPFALGVVVMIGVSAVMLFRIDVWLACAALIVIPLAVAVNVVFQKYMSPAITHAQQLRAEVSDVAHESFEAALLVKSLGTEAREERRFAARTDELRAANVRVGVVRAFFDPVIELLPSLGTLLVLGVGAARVSAGAVDTGEIVTAAYLLTIMAVPVRAFGWVLGELPRALVGYERIASVLDAPGIPVAGEQRLPVATRGAHVRFEDVGVDVRAGGRDVTLLDGIELDLAPGRTIAVVGPTGAGKTTLVSLLARLSDPTRGRVLIDGVDVRDALAADLTTQVALVAQSTFIFEDTVRSNVTLADAGVGPSDEQVWDALRLAKVDDVVSRLPGGLDSPLGERGSNLSGGQRQRLAIARALVRAPRLLVLDDATSAVDPRVEQQILAGLRGDGPVPAANPGPTAEHPTVVMVAYRMSSVALADQVVHVESGRVVDVGTHEELLARDAGYRDLAMAYQREAERRAEADELDGDSPDAHEEHDRGDEQRAEIERCEQEETDEIVRHAEEGTVTE
ncbi:ABC-type multidrug transport system fused ATPase/permease subunit [Oerskovia jenensis]|uniref:ABC-type multidrug transport system fused ATPase/permease subunit n=2 Tax=Oerskovia jenensis TaxID=162169 RepID=A0ABS2LAQ2_9CELL|nr:ABC-type multidrug transport system fused ATPase/permease subunit [Oerskovia jenensis]